MQKAELLHNYPNVNRAKCEAAAAHYGVKRTETHFDLCLNFILGQKVANKKSKGKYFK